MVALQQALPPDNMPHLFEEDDSETEMCVKNVVIKFKDIQGLLKLIITLTYLKNFYLSSFKSFI